MFALRKVIGKQYLVCSIEFLSKTNTSHVELREGLLKRFARTDTNVQYVGKHPISSFAVEGFYRPRTIDGGLVRGKRAEDPTPSIRHSALNTSKLDRSISEKSLCDVVSWFGSQFSYILRTTCCITAVLEIKKKHEGGS